VGKNTVKYITPRLYSERLVLKRGNSEDYRKVYEYDFRKLRDIAGEFEFVKLDPCELDGFENYADEEDVLDWILYLKDSMEAIGNLVADRVDYKMNSIELSFNLHPDYWGQGYMKEASIEVLHYLFEIGFESVLCGYDEGNKKSKRVIEKIGFQEYSIKKNAWNKNGVPITTYMYALSKNDFYHLYHEKLNTQN